MELDIDFKNYIEELASKYKASDLKTTAEKISKSYLENSGTNDHYVSDEKSALCYAIMRLPATFSAILNAIQHSFEEDKPEIKTVLDIGSGMGTSALALSSYFDNEIEFTLLERESAMIELGNKLLSYKNIKYKYENFDINTYSFDKQYDLVVMGYFINEFDNKTKESIIRKVCQIAKYVLIVEPGTPLCFNNLKNLKNIAVMDGMHVLAPCCHSACPLKENDWCHFTTRVARTRLHKFLKNADVPFEDEKFTYLMLTSKQVDLNGNRVLRHPIIKPNCVDLVLCTKNGIENKSIYKKEKDTYKLARKLSAGDKLI